MPIGMSRPDRRPRGRAAALTSTVLRTAVRATVRSSVCASVCASLAGCSRGPVLGESELRLQHDVRAVLQESADQLSTPGTRPRVATAITTACPSGHARTRLRGELPLEPDADPRLLLDRAAQLTLSLLHDRGYSLQAPPGGGHRERAFTMTREAPAVDLTVRLTGDPRPILLVDGTTPCLPH